MSSGRIPRYENLGATYDVFGKYAESESCKQIVIDWDNEEKVTWKPQGVGMKTFDVPHNVSCFTTSTTADYQSSYGESSTEYTQNLAVHAGLEGQYSFFSGSFSTDFEEDERQSLATSFTRINARVNLYTLSLPTIPDLRKMLTEDFVKRLDNMEPADLYTFYGTHIVNSLLVGGRASFVHATDVREYSSKISLRLAAELSCKAVMGSIKIDAKSEQGKAVESLKKSGSTRITTMGGDPKYGNEALPQNVSLWQESVSEAPVLVDFHSSAPLIPLWQLASTKDRQQKLLTALKDYYDSKNLELAIKGPYLQVRYDEPSLATDSYSNLYFTIPDVRGEWYFLGPTLQRTNSGSNTSPTPTLVAKEIVDGALAPVTWEVLATFKGGASGLRHRIWRAKAPRGYVALTDYTSNTSLSLEPPADQVKGLMAVHQSVCIKGKLGSKFSLNSNVYLDGLHDPTVWEITPSKAHPKSHVFWKVSSKNNEPSGRVLVLDEKNIQLTETEEDFFANRELGV